MKRSSTLSALLVALSLTTASAAFAAPANAAGDEPSRAATPGSDVQQQGDPAPSGTAPTPAPAAGDAPPAAPAGDPGAPTPAVSIGTPAPTPGSDQPAQSAPEEPKKKAPRPWAGTNVMLMSTMSTSTIFRGQQQYANPTADAAIWMLPRYALSKDWQLRGRLIFNYEMTNSDSTVSRNEPRFSDTTVQLFYRGIPAFAGIKPQVFAQLTAPTSPESRARTLLVSPGVGGNLVKPVPHVLGGELDFILLGSYSHPLYQSTQAEVRGNRPYAFSCAGGTNCQDLLSGTLNPSDVFVYAALATGTWGKWSPAIYYLGSSQFVYHPKDEAQVPLAGGATATAQAPEGFGRSSVRQTSYFAAWLDYEVNAWFTGEVGYSLSRAVLTEDATYGNPFFDRYQDMRVYLLANINVDALVEWMSHGGGDDQTGIVRSKSNHSPFRNF